MSPTRAVLGMFNWEETPGQTQGMLNGLYTAAGLGAPWHPPEGFAEGEKEVWAFLLELLPS